MANIFTNFLDSLSGDLKQTNLKDYKHASRLYVQNFYRLAPKHGFLYFVRFRLNPQVVGPAWQTSRQDLEMGMLVKKVDLPKISLDGTTLNVYNKKQPVYTKVTYQPINMALHDDNAGLVRSFWQMYYQYHTADSYYGGSNVTPGKMPLNTGNRYVKPNAVKNAQIVDRANPNEISYQDTTEPGRYGLDTTVTEPIIRSIEIYQLSRKQFFLHTLINPKIRSWNMDTLDQSKSALMEHNLTLEYEGVYFGKGKVTRYAPDGWTDLHYDLDPSPIGGLFGRGDGGLYGPYGLIAGGTDLFQDLQDTAADPGLDQRAALATLLKSAKLIDNAVNLNTDMARAQVYQSMITNVGFTVEQATSGSVTGLSIPSPATDMSVTEALLRGQLTTASPTNSGATRVSINTAADPFSTPDTTTTTTVSGTAKGGTVAPTEQERVRSILINNPNAENLAYSYYLSKQTITTKDQLIAANKNYQSLSSSDKRSYFDQSVNSIVSEVQPGDLRYITTDLINDVVNKASTYTVQFRKVLEDNVITSDEETQLVSATTGAINMQKQFAQLDLALSTIKSTLS